MAIPLPAPGEARKNLTRVLALMGLAAALLPLPVSAEADSGSLESLDPAVVEAMGAESGVSERSFSSVKEEGRAQVNVSRAGEEGNWAFGTAVIEAPKKEGHYPTGWLFVAESAGEGWNVALEGSPEFPALAAEAPEDIVSEGEMKIFASGSSSRSLSAKRFRTNLRLPWTKGRSWYMTGGPHGWNTGYDRPYAALDFTGAGASRKAQKVKSAAGGRVYTMCGNNRGWIRVYHHSGYTTDYYHLRKNIKRRDGSGIKRGHYLGRTGNNVSCGGASYGRHVHFTLLKGATRVPVHGKKIGGWRFVEGQAYRGYAQRGNTRRFPGSRIRNFGP